MIYILFTDAMVVAKDSSHAYNLTSLIAAKISFINSTRLTSLLLQFINLNYIYLVYYLPVHDFDVIAAVLWNDLTQKVL